MASPIPALLVLTTLLTITMASPIPEIALEVVNGYAFVPFDIVDPNKYLSTIFTIRKHFNSRLGADVIVRFLGSTGEKLYLHFQRSDLYCMKLNVGDETLGTPWLLGEGTTDRHIGVTEAYGKKSLGYEGFQKAVDEVIGSLKNVSVEDMRELKKNQKWKRQMNSYLTCILCMSIEAVRFHWLCNDHYLYEMSVKSEDRDYATGGEDAIIGAWGSTSNCYFKDGAHGVAKMDVPITPEIVEAAEKDTNLARSCVAVPCITDIAKYVAKFREQFSGIRGIQLG